MRERYYIINMKDRYRIFVAEFDNGRYILGTLRIWKELHHHQDWGQDCSLYTLFSFQDS